MLVATALNTHLVYRGPGLLRAGGGRYGTRYSTEKTIKILAQFIQSSSGRYRTRTCDPLLVRNKRGLEYLGFAGPTPVFMRFWVLVVVGCFVLLRSGWCPRGAPGSRFA